MGVPLDDTWIHFQFAENFAKGYLFQYNFGEPTAGTTSPLYVIVLGTASLVIKNFIVSSVLISSLFNLFCCILVYKISLLIFKGKYFSPDNFNGNLNNFRFLSFLASILTVLTGRFVWAGLSGMETTMFTFFCLMAVYYHLKNLEKSSFTYIPSLLFALAALSRPEGFLLYSIYILLELVNFFKFKRDSTLLLNLLISVLLFSALTLPYFIFSYQLSGNFLPNTFRGQGGNFDFIPDFNYLRIAFILFIRDNLITALLYVLAVIFYFKNIKRNFYELRYLNLIFLWIILLPLISSVVIPNWRHHVRYLIPLIPFINIIAVYYFAVLLKSKFINKIKNRFRTRRMVTAVLLMASFIYYVVYSIALGKNTGNINDQQVKLAEWVNKNVSRDETIAVNDIGAIKFINKNRIIDMAGLVTPEMLQYGKYNTVDRIDSVNYLLKKNNVTYIIIYDQWYKDFLDKYGAGLTFVTSAYLDDNTICGGDEMKVYKTNY
jgi:hypothetical protein